MKLSKKRKIEKNLRAAGIEQDPDEFISKCTRNSIILGIIISALAVMISLLAITKKDSSPIIFISVPVAFVLSYLLFFNMLLSSPNSKMKKRTIELESDLLYSSRFLLLKMESGSPLLNALIDVSALHTKSSKFFKEIVADIYMGTPLEEAIELAKKSTKSKSFSKILEEIRNSLRTGTDIERSLKATLNEMQKDHVIAIKEYGKKLSPLSMFYMILGTIVPSLGAAMMVIALGFVDLEITFTFFIFLLIGLAVTQVFFIMLFRAMKPAVMN